MSEMEESEGRAFDKAAWLENMSVSVRKGAAASKKLTKIKSGISLKNIMEGRETPREYLCPVSLQLMRDPVLLVQTGQVYDRESIEGWFKSGHNTDPVTGVRLKGKRLSPVFSLRSAIHDYAKASGIVLEAISEEEEQGNINNESGKDPMEIEPATVLGLEGISIYDIQSLCKLVHTGSQAEQVAALKLLADMTRYGDAQQEKRIGKHVAADTLKQCLESNTPGMAAQAARLMLHLTGESFSLLQTLNFLKMTNLQLREEVLHSIWQCAYRHRGKMQDVAKAVEDAGIQEMMAILKPLADTTSNDEVQEEVRSYAAFTLCCIALRPSLRPTIITEEITPLLIHFLNTTTDVGFRFSLLKACQYLSEDPRGRSQVKAAGGTRIFVLHLPPRNRMIMYSNRIFLDVFAWVSVAETAVKGLYHLSKDDRARQEMRTAGTIAALREMNRESKFPESARSKYLCPLIGRITAPHAT